MSMVLIESSINRARKLVRSKIKGVVDECRARKKISVDIHHSKLGGSSRLLVKLAQRTFSFLRPGQRMICNEVAVAKSDLGDLFFALPVELQLEVVNRLLFLDLLSLRRTSRRFRDLTIQNEGHIVRHHIDQWVPAHIIKLYPPPTDIPPTLGYLTDLAYRQRVSTHLALSLANQIVKEMMGGRQSRRMSREANDYALTQLQLGMAPLIFTLFHFLETYRTRKLERLLECEYNNEDEPSLGILNPLSPQKNTELQSDIISQYPDSLLLQVHQMYHLLIHLFMRRLSTAPLAVHRTFGRWTHSRPSNQVFAKVLILGGIKEVWHIYRVKGYCSRRKALDKYLKGLDIERTRRYGSCSGSKGKGNDARCRGLLMDVASGSTGNHIHNSRPPPPPMSKLARLDVDDLMDVWTPAAEERLLSREIVDTLDEVRCCGQFVNQLLGSTAESDDDDYDDDDDDDDEDDDDSEDGNDFADDETLPQLDGPYSSIVATPGNAWDGEPAEVDGVHDVLVPNPPG